MGGQRDFMFEIMMVKKIENEPQILRETMAYERTLRLQAEAELIAAKNTASKWKHKHSLRICQMK